MKGIDPHLVRLGVIALIAVGRVLIASSRKRKTSNPPPPPQSAPLPPPIGSAAPPMNTNTSTQGKKGTPDSPWSDLK